MFVPFFAISVLAYLSLRKTRLTVWKARHARTVTKAPGYLYVLYPTIGILLYIWVVLSLFPSPEAFIQKFDNTYHLNLIHAFYNTGDFSSLHSSIYPDVQVGGYYPALFHSLSSLLMTATSCSAPLAENAVLFVFLAIAFPLGIVALLDTLSEGNTLILLAGAFASVLFKGFYGNMLLWALFPNILGYALIPAALVSFIHLFPRFGIDNRWAYGILFAFCCVLSVFTHPNTLFSYIVFLSPFLIWQVWSADFWQNNQSTLKLFARVIVIIAIVAAIIVLWVVAYNLPMMRNVTSFTWHAFRTPAEAIFDALMLSYRPIATPQPVLALFVFIGIASCIREKNYRWLSAAFVLFSLFYICGAATDSDLKQLLIGFWYTDMTRIGGVASICAMPLATLGFASTLSRLTKLTNHPFAKNALAGSACILILALVLLPNGFIPFATGTTTVEDGYSKEESMRTVASESFGSSAFSALRKELRLLVNEDRNALTSDELEFAQQIKELVPNDARIANCPFDGSAWLYALDDLHVCYRRLSKTSPYVNPEVDLPKRLKEIATNDAVRTEVENSGITYVLQLDRKRKHDIRGNGYHKGDWRGIESINEKTPGFQLVLEDGDKRLFRIQSTAN